MMQKLKREGCLVYLISASAEFYLNELYNIKEVDKVIGTRFKCDKGGIGEMWKDLIAKAKKRLSD